MSKKWYAIYTHPRAEKKVHRELRLRGIDAYLPLRKILKQWSDRKKWIEEPLFRSYIFVNVPPENYLPVLEVPGVARFVTFEGKAVEIPGRQIEAVKLFIETGDFEAGTDVDLTGAKTVEIVRGPLKGILGELVEDHGKHKVRIEISAVGQSIVLTIGKNNLKVIEKKKD